MHVFASNHFRREGVRINSPLSEQRRLVPALAAAQTASSSSRVPSNLHQEDNDADMKTARPLIVDEIDSRFEVGASSPAFMDIAVEAAAYDTDPRERYQVCQVLRETIFGKVVLARDLCRDEQVAVKLSSRKNVHRGVAVTGEPVLENTISEAAIMKRLPAHPNVLSLLAEYQDETTHAMVLEYAPGGELFDVIAEHGAMDEQLVREKFRQIVSGVSHLHRHGVCHLDLSLENILIGADDILKICDFGVARVLPKGKFAACIRNKPGKVNYMCPELMAGLSFDGREADMFCLGVILFVLLTGLPPFEAAAMADKRFEWIWRGHLIPLLKKFGVDHLVPPEASDLLQRLLCHPDDRLTAEQVLNHPWLR